MNNETMLLDELHRRGIPIRARHLPLLESYLDLLETVGAHTNLTRILERNAMRSRHLVDSLLFGPLLGRPLGLKVVDLGCGAGLPSIPLAIVYKGWKITAIDSVRRKIDFLKMVKEKIHLPNIHPIQERLETLGHSAEHRERYDVCCARACGPLAAVLEYAFPLLKPGGRLVVATTMKVVEEAGQIQRIVETLGGGRWKLRPYRISGKDGRNFHHVLFVKEGQSPAKYPRKPQHIAKKPLSKSVAQC